jgi:hypothetical protein
MAQPNNRYYRPYLSDSESDSSSDSESDTSTASSGSSVTTATGNQPNYRQFATDLQLGTAAGPDLPAVSLQLQYTNQGFIGPTPIVDPSGDFPKTTAAKTTITGIIMLDSRDRDTKVFPQPTAVTLRLPRVYKNVTAFQIIQIKLLSSFLYFRADKNNLSVSIQEQGRLVQSLYGVINTNQQDLSVITSVIRPGTYDINTLITELTYQLNRTPVFYDYKNGFTDFAPLFATAGDYSLNFNQPGDNYYDAVTQTFIKTPTMTQIVQKYFQTLYAGLTSYTIKQLEVAYYYPVLKEILLDPAYGNNAINWGTPTTMDGYLAPADGFIRIVYTFQGLDDAYVQQIIDLNINVITTQSLLDQYRLEHTFRYTLINKYNISYSSNNNRITISSSSLNTSLVTLLNNKYNQYFAEQLTKYGFTLPQYNALSLTNTLILAVLTDMYYYLQKNLANYFGINFNSYSLAYFTHSENQLPLQGALNNLGVSSNYDANVILRNISPVSMNTLSTFRTPPSYYWPRLNRLSTTVSTFFNLNTTANPTQMSQYSHPYNMVTDSADYTRPFIDASGVIYQNNLYKSANVITPVNPAEYTVFKFRSNSRQTLKVTALPRPTKYRYNAYNAATYDASHVKIFDNSYCFVYNARNSAMDVSGINLVTLPGFGPQNTNFGITQAQSLALWGSSNVSLDINTNRTFFCLTTPKVTGATPGQVDIYTMSIRIQNVLTSIIKDPLQVYLYHDRGAFMADISDVRHEKAIHYKEMHTIINTNAYTFSFTAYTSQIYYILLRSQNTSFTTTQVVITPFFPNGTAYAERTKSLVGFDPLADPGANLTNFNYAQVADPDYIKLPIQPSLYAANFGGIDSNFYSFGERYVHMGYDSNQVSSDLTDYVGYIPGTLCNTYPNSATRIDPISGYIFQVGTGYNISTQTYLYNSTSFGFGNQILTSNAGGAYTSNIVPPTRQTVIAHWYNQVFIPNTVNQPYVPPNTYSLVYTSNVLTGVPISIYSYPYVQDIVYPNIFSQYTPAVNTPSLLQGYSFSDNALSLGDGVMGVSFIPDDGVWDVQRIMLRSAYLDSNADTNRNIKYLGIYPASYLNTLTGEQVKLQSSMAIFDFKSAITYGSTLTSNFGFDQVGGTYYEWIKSTNQAPSNAYFYGYAQNKRQMIPDSNSYYSIVPFDANSNITTYSLLSGSLVPYPFYSDASASQFYLDHASTPTGQFVITPKTKTAPDLNRGPPPGFDESQSKYEQSVPIGTSMLQYLKPPLLISDPSGCKPFGPSIFRGVNGGTIYQLPCFRVPNYALFPMSGNYNIYRYQNNTDIRTFTLQNTITPDQLFTNLPNTQIVGISGNNTELAFLGLQRVTVISSAVSVYQYKFNIETYNISTQTTTSRDTITMGYDTTTHYTISTTTEIVSAESFNYNDNRGFTFTFETGKWNPSLNLYEGIQQLGLAKGSPTTDTSQPLLLLSNLPGTLPGIQPYYEMLQTANESFGRFYVAAKTRFATVLDAGSPTYLAPTNLQYTMREPMLVNKYVYTANTTPYYRNGLFYVNPLQIRSFVTDGTLFPSLQNIGAPGVFVNSNLNTVATITRLILDPGSATPAAFGDITLVQNPYENKVFLSYDMYDMSNNGGIPSTTYSQITNYAFTASAYTSNAFYAPSKQIITGYDHAPLAPYKILGGGRGSFWTVFNEANRTIGQTAHKYDTLWGNRGDSTDFKIGISNAYQIFYPTQRIVMTKVARSYNPITDLSGLTFPEYPHTCLFAYEGLSKYISDISSNKWGLESNYLTADVTLSTGFYFNACQLEVPMTSNNTYYIALRGYSPTEKSQVMMRFSLPNRYDFGYVKISDLSNEIIMAANKPSMFNSNYAYTIQSFNSNFIFDANGRLFGSNIIQGFPGSNFSNVAGFGDFMNQFTNLYNVYNTNVQVLSNINTATQVNIQTFIRNDLAAIIPLNAINRQRYTDPIVYSILWKSALPAQYAKAEDNWGLGWNLGFNKIDTPYLTTQTGQSFFKILDDFINLRMSPEFNMNQMDTGSKENLQISTDTTGSIKAYYGKLLLAGFGSYAQTLISNPITFQIPIPKIDKLTFLWVDNFGQTINNADCEWNAVIQLVERMDTVTAAAPTVVFP